MSQRQDSLCRVPCSCNQVPKKCNSDLDIFSEFWDVAESEIVWKWFRKRFGRVLSWGNRIWIPFARISITSHVVKPFSTDKSQSAPNELEPAHTPHLPRSIKILSWCTSHCRVTGPCHNERARYQTKSRHAQQGHLLPITA